MRVIYLLLSFMLCFYPVTQAQNTTNQFMTQAQSTIRKTTRPPFQNEAFLF